MAALQPLGFACGSPQPMNLTLTLSRKREREKRRAIGWGKRNMNPNLRCHSARSRGIHAAVDEDAPHGFCDYASLRAE